jgi:pimeloyl-ACP methyl ester carboxylesterase
VNLKQFHGRVLVITGDLDPFATEADVEDFLHDLGTSGENVVHVRLQNIGHMPYVEAAAQEVQQIINEFVDAATIDVR